MCCEDLCDEAYEVFFPIVEEYCNCIVSQIELERVLDYLFDLIFDERMLDMFKQLCRKYYTVYVDSVVFYIDECRRLYVEETTYL